MSKTEADVPWSDSESMVEFHPENSLREHLITMHGLDTSDDKYGAILHKHDHSRNKRKSPAQNPIVNHSHKKR